jgi:hypothetical protein
VRAIAVGVIVALLGGLAVATAAPEPAQAATVACDGTSATDQNQLRVAPSHGTVFYIDSGQGQQLDAAYAAYRVTNVGGSARTDLWTKVDSFTGGVVGLANPADAIQPLGAIAASGSNTSFTLLKATASTSLAQSHVVHVYQGKPGTVGATELYSCSYTFSKVAETIKAAANKVTDLQTTTSTVIGSTLTVTVQGNTGTIGAGNAIDGSMMWFSPAARSTWPTGALRLESTLVNLYSNNGRTNLSGSYANQLRIPTSSGSKYYYTATYTFRVIGSSAVPASVIPIAQISSGTQIKHTDLASISSASLATDSATVAVKVTKATSTLVDVADGVSTFSYTVTLANSGSAVTLDSVVDTRSEGLDYVPGSAQFNGSATSSPTTIAGDSSSLVFSGPFALPAGTSGTPTTRTLTYQLSIATCSGTFHYTNSATGAIGSLVVGSDSSHISVSHALGTCGDSTITTYTENQGLDPEVTTSPATSIATTTARINGLVDPNGVAGASISFSYGTDPDLAGATTVSAGTTTSATSPYAVYADLSGLASGTTYYFRVTGGTAVGEILSFVTSEPVGTPTVMTTAATDVTTAGAVTFNGFIDPNQVPNGAKVKFQYATDSSGGACTSLGTITTPSSFVQSETDSSTSDAIYSGAFPSATSYSVTGLASNTRYCFRIVGYYNATTANWATSVAGSWMSVLTTTKTAQTITFPAITDAVYGTSRTAAATASSTLAVAYTSNTPTVCTVAPSGAIVLLAAGTCSITASQDGSDAYTAATSVTVAFTVTKASQTISYSPVTSVTAGDSVPLDGTATSGLTVEYTAGPSNVCAIVAGELVTGPDSGVCTVEATQPGNAAYTAAAPVSVDITVLPGPPVVTTTSLPDAVIGEAYDETLAAAGGDGSYSDWTIVSGALPDGLVFDDATGRIHGTPTSAGSVVLEVTVDSATLTSVVRELTLRVVKKTPTITASDITVTYGDADGAVTASTTSGGTLSYQVGDTAIVTVTGGTLHTVAAGSTTLRIVSVETAEYAEAEVTVDVAVNRALLTVTAPSPSVTYGDPAPTYTPTVTGFVLLDDAGTLTSSPTCSSTYTAGSAAGSAHAVVCLDAAAANYDIVYVDGAVLIAKAAQTITVSPNAPVDMPPGSTQTFTATALGDGVTSITTSGPCAWSAGVLTADSTEGECVVTISVPASTNHLAAGPIERRLQVSVSALIPRSLSLALDVPGTSHVLSTALTLVPTVGPVAATPVYTVDAGSASVCRLESDLSITLLAVGECVITASIPADTTYAAANATLRFDVVRATRTLGLSVAAVSANVGGTVRLTATPSAGGGTITYRLADLAGHCSLVGDIVTALSVGSCDVVADIDPDATYLTARSSTERLQVLAIPAPPTAPSPSVTSTPDETEDAGDTSATTAPSTAGTPRAVSDTSPTTLVIRSAGRLPQPSPGVGIAPTGIASNGFRSAAELANEVMGGFTPGTGARVQVTGARTAAQFVIDPSTIADPLGIVAALDESRDRLAADFAEITSAEIADRPANEQLLGGRVSHDARAVFEAAGLADPILVDDLGVTDATRWIVVTADASGYVPGSVVYLVVTTQPVIVGAAVVDRDGLATLSGAIPADPLPAGAHDLRVVGTRSLTGATANGDGEIILADETMADIQRFDAGTWATVEITGTAVGGGAAVAVRVVLLGLEAPWWTVFVLGILALLLLALLLWRRPERGRWRIAAAMLVGVAFALPAIAGWLTRSYEVIAVGAVVALIGAGLALATRFAGTRRRREHAKAA